VNNISRISLAEPLTVRMADGSTSIFRDYLPLLKVGVMPESLDCVVRQDFFQILNTRSYLDLRGFPKLIQLLIGLRERSVLMIQVTLLRRNVVPILLLHLTLVI
jgi:hypothetical protein